MKMSLFHLGLGASGPKMDRSASSPLLPGAMHTDLRREYLLGRLTLGVQNPIPRRVGLHSSCIHIHSFLTATGDAILLIINIFVAEEWS
jgi:hypothetical protein